MKKRETGLIQKAKYLKTVLLLTACMVVVAACSSSKPQVNMDETQNFADIKTFYIQPPLNPINATLANIFRGGRRYRGGIPTFHHH